MGLNSELPPVDKKSVSEIMLERTGIDINRCRLCKTGTMEKIHEIPEGSGPSAFYIICEARNKDGP
jgi:hypothetical protein